MLEMSSRLEFMTNNNENKTYNTNYDYSTNSREHADETMPATRERRKRNPNMSYNNFYDIFIVSCNNS